MIPRALLLTPLLALTLGCPGQRRPAPWVVEALAQQRAEEEARARREALVRPEPSPSAAASPAPSVSLSDQVAAWAERVGQLVQRAGERDALLRAEDDLRRAGDSLLERALDAEDADLEERVYTVQEQLSAWRARLVEGE